jgi:hypothetical protein
VERATGALMLALQQPPEAVAHALKAAARRHDVPVHELAEAVVTVAQGGLVPSPLLRKVLWEEWGDLLRRPFDRGPCSSTCVRAETRGILRRGTAATSAGTVSAVCALLSSLAFRHRH